MADKVEKLVLKDGTLVQHKIAGYRGRINGTTGIKSCFTSKGAALASAATKETFQYRVAVAGEPMRHIAPAEDLEVMAEEQRTNISCFSCNATFRSKPNDVNKAGGRCECGGWICPECFACQPPGEQSATNGEAECKKQRKRLLRKQGQAKKAKPVRAI